MRLAPYGSVFVVLRLNQQQVRTLKLDQPELPASDMAAVIDDWDNERASLTVFNAGDYRLTTEDGRRASSHVAGLPEPITVTGPWQVRFAHHRGQTQSEEWNQLMPWPQHADEAIRHFSGIAEYRCSIDIPEAWLTDRRRVVLDLGELWAVGKVDLNGKSLGVLWKPPFTLDVTQSAVAGANELVVEVANTWSNRLVGDAELPNDQRVTRTNVTTSAGVRWRDVPLLKSGLFGPVRLLPAATVEVEPR